VEEAFQLILNSILASKEEIPWQISFILHQICLTAQHKFPNQSPTYAVGGFFFLRFVCPAIVVPDQAQIVSSSLPKNALRGLLFITKIIQTMANNVTFGAKESQMAPFNDLIERNKIPFEHFLFQISQNQINFPNKKIEPRTFSDQSFDKLKNEIITLLDKLEPVLYSNV